MLSQAPATSIDLSSHFCRILALNVGFWLWNSRYPFLSAAFGSSTRPLRRVYYKHAFMLSSTLLSEYLSKTHPWSCISVVKLKTALLSKWIQMLSLRDNELLRQYTVSFIYSLFASRIASSSKPFTTCYPINMAEGAAYQIYKAIIKNPITSSYSLWKFLLKRIRKREHGSC